MNIRWRNFWFLVSFWPLVIVIWLIWQLPGQGFFRLDLKSLYLPQNGMVLVALKDGVISGSYPLVSCDIGWKTFKELWPLMLFAMLSGYPVGMLYLCLFRFLAGKQEPPRQETAEENALKIQYAELTGKLWEQECTLQSLRKEKQEAREDIATLNTVIFNEKYNNQRLKKTCSTMERELFKARAKIKRLEAREQRKSVAPRSWPEYNDDMSLLQNDKNISIYSFCKKQEDVILASYRWQTLVQRFQISFCKRLDM